MTAVQMMMATSMTLYQTGISVSCFQGEQVPIPLPLHTPLPCRWDDEN